MDGAAVVEKIWLMLGSAMTPAAMFGVWKYLVRDTKSTLLDEAFHTRDLALAQAKRLREDGYVMEAQEREMDGHRAVARVLARFSFYRSHPRVIYIEILYAVTLAAVVVASGLALLGVPNSLWPAVTLCLLSPFVLLAFLVSERWASRTISEMASLSVEDAQSFRLHANEAEASIRCKAGAWPGDRSSRRAGRAVRIPEESVAREGYETRARTGVDSRPSSAVVTALLARKSRSL